MTLKSLSRLSALLVPFACGGTSEHVEKLRVAVDQAKLSLGESVDVALGGLGEATAIQAVLLVDGDPVFSVGALADGALREVRVDTATGDLLSTAGAKGSGAACPDALTLTEALAIAESTASGDAVAIVPDDDVACAREVQVLVGETLMEVKVAGDGAVLEHEVSDENED